MLTVKNPNEISSLNKKKDDNSSANGSIRNLDNSIMSAPVARFNRFNKISTQTKNRKMTVRSQKDSPKQEKSRFQRGKRSSIHSNMSQKRPELSIFQPKRPKSPRCNDSDCSFNGSVSSGEHVSLWEQKHIYDRKTQFKTWNNLNTSILTRQHTQVVTG